jgi:hypothetical protein
MAFNSLNSDEDIRPNIGIAFNEAITQPGGEFGANAKLPFGSSAFNFAISSSSKVICSFCHLLNSASIRRADKIRQRTMNPGLAYVAVAWQLVKSSCLLTREGNREGGSGTGFRAQLLFFLDDMIPKVFDKPLLSDKPERSLIAWH